MRNDKTEEPNDERYGLLELEDGRYDLVKLSKMVTVRKLCYTL